MRCPYTRFTVYESSHISVCLYVFVLLSISVCLHVFVLLSISVCLHVFLSVSMCLCFCPFLSVLLMSASNLPLLSLTFPSFLSAFQQPIPPSLASSLFFRWPRTAALHICKCTVWRDCLDICWFNVLVCSVALTQ